EPFEMMFPLRGANGAFRLFLTRVLPVRNESGQVERWLGTNTDITARHDIEMALKDREARLNAYATQQKAIADFSLQAITGVDSITGITRLAL
ncbi:PAS domain-containing protein, partial [Salmonella enterica]|uniref:PAS domain-containing protein n=1 Tax=Salmonella enterica TaxID=28901 RepID=UPI003D287C77